ncbi:hypothetical protein ACH4Y0_37815 [Streptomyces sp. NPDC020707]|uniref:hypothetical protein n=1 Tax=Streptomyces sp. NPDC020707 TaxID=3365084 RepID=UPI00379C94E0
MRLRTTCPATPRSWTVELRSHPHGLVLVCQHCPHGSTQVAALMARSAALAHLARHARGHLLPLHLRTCQCRERGCHWHSRHRGCTGPIRLLLARERGGRVWRLTDTCTACAAATEQAAVVPDTALARAPRPPAAPRRHKRQPKGPGERARVREMLNYLAAALPESTTAAARLLALQCALRMDATMHVQLARGMLRGLRLDNPAPWRELEQVRWLRNRPRNAINKIRAELLDAPLLDQAPARRDRTQAADWALRVTSSASAQRRAGPLLELAALYLVAHADPGTGVGQADLAQMARTCGTRCAYLSDLLEQLAAMGSLASWQVCHHGGDLTWRLTC